MNELLSKITTYNIFNYLLPGIVFAILARETIHYPVVQSDIFTGAFLYYFLGLVVSRFGSLIVEPLLKALSFVKFEDYKDYVDQRKRMRRSTCFRKSTTPTDHWHHCSASCSCSNCTRNLKADSLASGNGMRQSWWS